MKDTAKKPILVIMAAGMGSRFGGLKQIEAVGPAGEAILDYSLFDAHRAGFETVVFIIKHAIEDAFKSTVGARAEKAGLNVRYAYQELDILPEGFTVPEAASSRGAPPMPFCLLPMRLMRRSLSSMPMIITAAPALS